MQTTPLPAKPTSSPTEERENATTSLSHSRPSPVPKSSADEISISGILYKWVNFGRRWRPRWFILRSGILSYYRMHSPNPSRLRFGSSGNQEKVILGQIHLKVALVKESTSDERLFTIYSEETKPLRLKAENGEDRAAWLKALYLACKWSAVNDSVQNLRRHLGEEGLSDVAIQETENIMRTELFSVYNRLGVALHKHKNNKLSPYATFHLQRDKAAFENNVVTHQSNSPCHGGRRHEDASQQIGVDATSLCVSRDMMSMSSFKSAASNPDLQDLSSISDDDEAFDSEDAMSPSLECVAAKFAHVKRRKKLPDPVERKDKGTSLWSLIKDNIGKDLTRICLPVYFNEPLSSLQKCFEEFEYSYLIDRAYEWGKMGNSLMRILNVVAFAVSGYASTDGRTCKPFNPLLGETYEAVYLDKGIRFISEKVSHHPVIVAYHCEGRGWKLWGDCDLKSKCWGRSIQLDPVGVMTLEFDDGEIFYWSKVTTSICNLILGNVYCDHYGTTRIDGNGDYSCKLNFKEHSVIDNNRHEVEGIVRDKHGKTAASIFGKWDESMQFVSGRCSRKGKQTNSTAEACLLWKRSEPSKCPTRYNLSRFAITLNEITPELKEKLPPTDSRLRPDQRYLENGEYERANREKIRLEQKQQQSRDTQERGWKPRWFARDKGRGTYRYIGGYWEAREQGNWESCPHIFGNYP